ncbi:MAG TPA: squalene synthase HpnC [Planctomycetaceae bacterium]|nr:squalene synthase HpnC [Planctomycetaceae bacterium]
MFPDFAVYGPEAEYRTPTLSEAFAYCERLTRSHYENFTVGSFLLPRLLRRPFYAIYSYCRWADDLGDETGGGPGAVALLDWWEGELDRCYALASQGSVRQGCVKNGGRPTHPVFVAMRDVFEHHALPKKPFADLLVAFRRDQRQFRYATMEDLLDYCRYSADPVGRIILHLAASVWQTGGPNEQERIWSDSICTGLQLANHWQDVRRDREIGRSYIPEEYRERFGVSIDAPVDGRAFREMMKALVDDAEKRLLAGLPLAESVPKPLRFDIRLFVRGGLATLHEIRKIDYAVLERRPTVSKRNKLCLLLKAWADGFICRNRTLHTETD